MISAFIVSRCPKRSAPAKAVLWSQTIRCCLSGRHATTTWACSARRMSKFSGEAAVKGMIGSQYRMSEFTGGVLLAQLKKLDTIVGSLRTHANRVYEGLSDVPGLNIRHRPDPAGDIGSGIWLGFHRQWNAI